MKVCNRKINFLDKEFTGIQSIEFNLQGFDNYTFVPVNI